MDAIDLLTRQHRELDTLFEELGLASPAERPERASVLADALWMHTALEEELFYPALDDEEWRGLVEDAAAEHLEQKRYLSELLGLSPEDAAFEGRRADLERLVRDHVEAEETALFPAVRRQLAPDWLEALARRMEATQDDLALERLQTPRREAPERVVHVPIG